MKTEPIVPATLAWNDDGLPFSPPYDDPYHPRAGALQQAQHVFLGGNGLPERWRGRERFVVLETGFGLGNNFLATWDAWRRDASACRQLHFISIERHPLPRADLLALPRDAALVPLAEQLAQSWPPLTPNLHRLSFDGGRVQLLLALGDVAQWLPELVARVDAFYLDGFAPARNPQMWQPRLFKAMGRLAAPGATAATWTAAHVVRDGLMAAGFDAELTPGRGGKRDILRARYAPAFVPRRAPARSASPLAGARHAAVIGAGLAGCAAAWALAEQGWTCCVLDRHGRPAEEASGNPAGLFHGIVNPQDGVHARFNRAAALEAERVIRFGVQAHGVGGDVQGLLRLETSGAGVGAMRGTLHRLGLPPTYVQALEAAEASEAAGLRLTHPAWFYPGGGWVKPVELARSFLDRTAGQARFRGSAAVHALRRANARWQLLDAAGAVIEEADAVVLANAGDALRLLGHPPWPMQRVRGQLSLLPAESLEALPRVPVAGAGYLLPAIDGRAVFGATAQPGDTGAALRDRDHADNLTQLARLGLAPPEAVHPVDGRVGWRWTTVDRLPVIGAVPDPVAAAQSSRLDQPRFVPRQPGLFVFTALGSRGITWCSLGAQVLASVVTGAPSPLESSLLDAVDPARFLSRVVRRSAPGR
ncbi:bifunctional tRNA (5-methylaminomethyl-2-thiouridine)(34)-methyltransferase MnmD/FAD-dependent 5-carboxymethylaminomethyl-2-thiouridine(34) oxidoreductase MnmC [Piscinibacter sp.]|uniref:bifunctional tRNA (5-methylaminomethyl-2-thiouridine)(34)-methyltransferase MnmD/FAD-dependent 5-carboxymethylaminomethyl-2-thiouridine(34) oxidoreductase MnmC n=1 Tax=Piscinibacter sp. TaxID=1903157 RepID=UPI002D1D732A|nr:bifunctional tRNA (5-methylaminomethyl-2-thiouridine)(34)-methyltransferase MnmD/FAD-dependent 5-carboxymethylaminomethyl-2-thiouridine(34) oxidoreductase MnmC [Albitalea sp.]HUG23340.1 bifunctional tRNA (5-methylaminomethyl-2-thiouridine)(34)-methyltransferase MnmD/FAD-dependent 5-carboxymethylaminomethyl-2-thiouridine(34) oxidoreductase MnmC [Albitalea sp.]